MLGIGGEDTSSDDENIINNKRRKLKPTEEINLTYYRKNGEDEEIFRKDSCKEKSGDQTDIGLNCSSEIKMESDKIKNNNDMTKSTYSKKLNVRGHFQNNSDLIMYEGHPQNAVEELDALSNEKLTLGPGGNGDIMKIPQTNITYFSVYDENGILCPIDEGMVENGVRIFMSGYIKSIFCDSHDVDEESIAVKDVGPIIKWLVQGLFGGNSISIKLSTEYGEYNLLKPSKAYTPLMNNLHEKIGLSKVVNEYLESNYYLRPKYKDLIVTVCQSVIPELKNRRISEEMLHKHAQFVCDQLVSLETNKGIPLVTLPCIDKLIKKMGIKIGNKKVNEKGWTKATTTPLVQKTFKRFFKNQIDKSCPNMDVDQAIHSKQEDEDEFVMEELAQPDKVNKSVPLKLTRYLNPEITFVGNPIKTDSSRVYYKRVQINHSEYQIGDFVLAEPSRADVPALVIRIVYMWVESRPFKPREWLFHGEMLMRAYDTILGDVGNPRELFHIDHCCHGAPISAILGKANVERKETPKNWFELGGKNIDKEFLEDDGKTFYYNKYYDRYKTRFEDLPEDPACPNDLRKHRFCPSCERKITRDIKEIPRVFGRFAQKSDIVTEPHRTEWAMVRWRDHDYKKGMGVFLKPGTFKLKNNLIYMENKKKLKKVDESTYPEYYRKSSYNERGSNNKTRQPFCVGYIAAITVRRPWGPLIPPQNIYLKVNILYRPENTSNRFPQREDLNVVYWSDDLKDIPFSAVYGPCNLIYENNVPNNGILHEWLKEDPNNFYFSMAYNKKTKHIVRVPQHAKIIGITNIGKGKGKGKSTIGTKSNQVPEEKLRIRPLRTLDVFAGCGGLSEGLHQSGVAECKWAIDNIETAAHAYSLNNKNCIVYNEDCNVLLKDVILGATHSKSGLRLPVKGEVELLCGGPPCQGYSGMNRFNSREYSILKNSLVASYLSYCDFYRPKYFILENVRNFVAFKKGMVLKLTLRSLLDMGYQCTFAVLQAGNYGVPQSRRRLIIFAAAPGYKLPVYPEPTHVFNNRNLPLETIIDGKRYTSNIRWKRSAPKRTCTIYDAMRDLPEIANGANEIEIDYDSIPGSHFQRLVRSEDASVKLRDHICKKVAPLIEARISQIPIDPGSDWRDLPNISLNLPDGTKCKVLQYKYEDKQNGRSTTGAMRGVCACASGRPCSYDRQENTLIPWCLPHTANRHSNWAGLYGRISWDGYFSTTVTDPEPIGTQGRVLHPEQNRVVSVRECARSQGFSDAYMFAGSIQDKYRQIGNAVPPQLGAALGREIIKSLSKSQTTHSHKQ